jgi:hypothetical protein
MKGKQIDLLLFASTLPKPHKPTHKVPQALTQTKALSKSLQSQPRRKRNFKKCPTARQKTMKMTSNK